MNEYTASAVIAVAIFATVGFICWLHARYPRSSGERESSVYKWTITQAQPGRIAPNGNIECASPRRPKPVPPMRPAQPKEEKGKEVRPCQHG